VSKRKLLLADDSITIQKVVNLTFADEGFEVISVGDGNSAIDKLRENSPDLVLADVNMPGLNGYEICEKIKETNRDMPVILLVGSFEPFDEDEAKRVGADDYLTKPFQSISQLVSKVTNLLNSEKQDSVDGENFVGSEDQTFNNLEDSDTDDEIIQTNQIGSLPSDEFSKFETQDSETYEKESNADSGNETAEFPIPEAASVLELDEMNLLELPPLEFPEVKIQNQNEAETFEKINLEQISSKPTDSDLRNNEIISPFTSTKTFEDSEDDAKFEDDEKIRETISAEMLEIITQKVVKKLSEKVIKEIAWEVVPQMAEVIIKKMAEEKMKD
jgi:DNA-binding response OmpR family regulator